MDTAADIVRAANASAAELRRAGHEPVRYRMHPLDAELIVAARNPEKASTHRLRTFTGLPVIYDENLRLGEPVAEFEPVRKKQKALTEQT